VKIEYPAAHNAGEREAAEQEAAGRVHAEVTPIEESLAVSAELFRFAVGA